MAAARNKICVVAYFAIICNRNLSLLMQSLPGHHSGNEAANERVQGGRSYNSAFGVREYGFISPQQKQ